MTRPLLGALAAVTLAVAAAGALTAPTQAATSTATPARSTAASAAADYVPPAISWGACEDPRLASRGAQCGFVVVPLDYDDVNGAKVQIAVSRIKHKTPDSQYQGPLLANPGGPGGSGLILAAYQAFIPNGAGLAYDWIGFDPRGVGSSRPALACDPNYFPFNRPDYVPLSDTVEQFWLDKSAKYAADCKAAGGALLDHIKTTDNVNDIESIRKALGAPKISWYGFSYGTELGQVYATQHPDRVHRMVLDGVVDPSKDWYTANLAQDVAFEKTINIFFAWVAENDETYHLGTTQAAVRQVWQQMLQKSRQAPFAGKIGPDEWTDSFVSAAYYVYGWEDTAKAFAAAVKGKYGRIITQYVDANGAPGPGSDNGYSIYLGTQCTDAPWPKNYAKIRKDNFKTYAIAPFETWANAWYNGPCLTWAGKAAKAMPTIDGTQAPKILMVSETFDAATPFAGAIEARRRFPRSVLIEGVNGSTHAGTLSGVACTDDRIAAYLRDGTLDKRVAGDQSDVKCPPVPAPDPTQDSARTAAPGAGIPADLRAALTSVRH